MSRLREGDIARIGEDPHYYPPNSDRVESRSGKTRVGEIVTILRPDGRNLRVEDDYGMTFTLNEACLTPAFREGERVLASEDAHYTLGGTRYYSAVAGRICRVQIGEPDQDGDIQVVREDGQGSPEQVSPTCLSRIPEPEVEAEIEVEADVVNHPPHYTAYPGVEVIQLTEHMNFCRGNAVKYIARAGLKDKATEIQDLEKSVWYLNREIARLRLQKAVR